MTEIGAAVVLVAYLAVRPGQHCLTLLYSNHMLRRQKKKKKRKRGRRTRRRKGRRRGREREMVRLDQSSSKRDSAQD